jgi:hypothetical protein
MSIDKSYIFNLSTSCFDQQLGFCFFVRVVLMIAYLAVYHGTVCYLCSSKTTVKKIVRMRFLLILLLSCLRGQSCPTVSEVCQARSATVLYCTKIMHVTRAMNLYNLQYYVYTTKLVVDLLPTELPTAEECLLMYKNIVFSIIERYISWNTNIFEPCHHPTLVITSQVIEALLIQIALKSITCPLDKKRSWQKNNPSLPNLLRRLSKQNQPSGRNFQQDPSQKNSTLVPFEGKLMVLLMPRLYLQKNVMNLIKRK